MSLSLQIGHCLRRLHYQWPRSRRFGHCLFRPLIADSTTLTAFNNGELSEDSFVSRAGTVCLTEAGRKSVLSAYERRLQQEVTHPLFGYRVSYRRILHVQARLLARHVLGELPEYPSFTTR